MKKTITTNAALRSFIAATLLAFALTGCGGDSSGVVPGAPSNPTTNTVPSAPLGVNAVPGNAQVSLSWSSVAGATAYNLYWSTTSGVSPVNGTKVAGLGSSYLHSALTNGTTYYYVLTAVNSAGESAPSPQISATPSGTVAGGYTIGGYVVGLASGQSVVLQNNGGDDLTVTADGSFTFNTPLAYNAPYDVTVSVQPANGQTCAVATDYSYGDSSGTGTVLTANVDTVRISCYSVSTFAGSGMAGQGDAVGEAAVFNSPSGIAFDLNGNLYVTDVVNDVIRKITPEGLVSTLAGSVVAGYTDATGAEARFNFSNPGYVPGIPGIAVDSSGYVYVADTSNNVIRKISPNGVVSTLAGSGVAGYNDATGTAAQFNLSVGYDAFGYTPVAGIAVDKSGNVYVADSGNNRIRKITPAGVVTTLAGSTVGYTDATGSAAQFYWPQGVAVDSTGNVYVADYGNCVIRKVTPTGVVTTFAGADSGYTDAAGSAAEFWYPVGITMDAAGTLYVTDHNKVVRKISPSGLVSTIAGSWSTGYTEGPAIAAKFERIEGIAVDSAGNIYVADRGANRIRKIAIKPYSYTLGGHVVGLKNGSSLVLQNNGGDGLTVTADGLFTFATPLTDISGSDSYNVSILTQPAGQTCTIANNTGGFTTGNVSTVSINCAQVSTLAGAGTAGFANGSGSSAQFDFTWGSFDEYTGVAADSAGNVYVADTQNCVIRKITPAGVASTFAGTVGTCSYLDSTTATTALFKWPHGVAVDDADNVYVGDSNNAAIRKITQAGVVTTLASSATVPAGTFFLPMGIDVDAAGNVYVADRGTNKILKVTQAGVVTTLAGGTSSTFNYTNGPGAVAQFDNPTSVAVDSQGNVFVADYKNSAIRKITPDGMVSTFAGGSEPGGGAGYVNSTGSGALFDMPSGVAVDAADNVYVTDTWNNVIRVIDPMGTVLTLAGPTAPTTTAGHVDGNGADALFNYPDGIAVDGAGNVYVVDSNNFVIRKIVQ